MRSAENRRPKLYRGAWYVVWTERVEGKTVTKRETLRTKDRAQAERNFEEYIRQTQASGGTISDILDRWSREKKDLASIEIAKRKFIPIKSFFGNLLPDQITRDLCKEYRKNRKVKNNTVRGEIAVLRSAINWNDPHNKAIFELPPSDPPKDHFITKQEYKAMLSKCDGHLELFIIVALHTGARSNAILDLTWDRVNFEKKYINFAKGAQTNKRRALVPMNQVLLKYLNEAHRGRTCDYIIEYGGKKVLSVRKGFGKTCQRAKVTASPHVMRHTSAMVMAEGSVPLTEIEQFLGHTGGSTTQRVYAKYSPSYLQKAASALEKWHIQACGSR